MSVSGVGGTSGYLPIEERGPAAPPAAADASAPAARTVAPGTPALARRPDVTAAAAGSVGTLADGTKVSFDASTGTFRAVKGRISRSGAQALYQAAELVAEGNVAFFERLDEAGKAKLADTLAASISKDRGTRPPTTEDLRWRSGSATIALALMRRLPEGDPQKAKLLDAYLKQLAVEPEKGLKATSVLNLEDAVKKGEVNLTPAQASALAAAKEATLPSKPPYDGWFKNGKTDLNVKQYIHPEFYESMMSGYRSQGFRVDQDLGDGHVRMSKVYTDPSNGKTMKVNVEVIKTYAEGHKPEKRLFNDMSDPNTDIEFYTGHSNLGGNVLGALQAGPKEQNGDKWVINWMCRGKQVLADVYNRFPNAHYTTTTDPAYVVHSNEILNGIFQGIAERKSYDEIWKKMGDTSLWFGPHRNQQLKDWFMPPNDPRILQVRDLDKDGRVDLSKLSGLDPLYNVGQTRTTESAPRFRPVATNVNPQDIPGDKVMRGVNFLNTILTYHLDEIEHPGGNDGRLPKDVGDKIFAGGWYKSETDEIVKVEEKKVEGKTVYEVKVNSKYKDQDVDTLGVAIAYEVNKYLSIRKNGAYTEQDKLRGANLAGEYMAYMCDTYEEVTDIVEGMKQKYGFPARLTWEALIEAKDGDTHGYASPDGQRILKEKIGPVDPRIG
jgi:hypothetical protein